MSGRSLFSRAQVCRALTCLAIGIAAAAPLHAQAKPIKQPGAVRLAKFDPNSPIGNASNVQEKARPMPERGSIDKSLEDIYVEIHNGQLSRALALTDALIERVPGFRVAYLIRGDLLLLKSGFPVKRVGDMQDVPIDRIKELLELREEATVRLRAYAERPSKDQLPRELVQLRSEEKYVILVDTLRSRLYLYENVDGVPRWVTDFYISQGKMGAEKEKEGDQKTPLGVYTITDFLPKQKLTDFYGPLALPINYPNEWDKRQGRTGHGIWLHGIPSNFVSRPPKASDGCVVLSNSDIERLQSFVKVGATPVVIVDSVHFVDTKTWQTERVNMLRLVENWRRDLENKSPSLMSHYSNQGYVDGQPAARWKDRFVESAGKVSALSLTNLSMMRYPAKDNMFVVSFEPGWDGKKSGIRRKQYWLKEGTQWRIVHEVTEG